MERPDRFGRFVSHPYFEEVVELVAASLHEPDEAEGRNLARGLTTAFGQWLIAMPDGGNELYPMPDGSVGIVLAVLTCEDNLPIYNELCLLTIGTVITHQPIIGEVLDRLSPGHVRAAISRMEAADSGLHLAFAGWETELERLTWRDAYTHMGIVHDRDVTLVH